MKEKIIKTVSRFLLTWFLIILIVIAIGVIVVIPGLILNHFGTSPLAFVLLFLYITFLIAAYLSFEIDIV